MLLPWPLLLLLLEPRVLVLVRLVGEDAPGLRLDVALVLALALCDWHDRSRIEPA